LAYSGDASSRAVFAAMDSVSPIVAAVVRQINWLGMFIQHFNQEIRTAGDELHSLWVHVLNTDDAGLSPRIK
jgi:hypothetical protein